MHRHHRLKVAKGLFPEYRLEGMAFFLIYGRFHAQHFNADTFTLMALFQVTANR